MYLSVYNNLCNSRKLLHDKYKQYSGLHKHHIIPKHCGGDDSIDNITFLTVREHILAHFMLWKINKNINDLRSMKMLGANLSTSYRQKIGMYCVTNKIGFYSDNFTFEQKSRRSKASAKTQKEQNIGIHNTEMKSLYCSMGGRASIISENNYLWKYWASDVGRKIRASLGGKSHIGKWWIYNTITGNTSRCYKNDFESFYSQGWIRKFIYKPNKGKFFGQSSKRRKVTDGNNIFESVLAAAKHHSITPGTVVYRCKSAKNSSWNYVS